VLSFVLANIRFFDSSQKSKGAVQRGAQQIPFCGWTKEQNISTLFNEQNI
jgi:hypothetical protein